MKLVNIIALFLCLAPGKGGAQSTHKGSLPVIDADAFYAIDLPYEVLGGARPDLADIRLLDGTGKEVAWLLREDAESNRSSEFIPLPMEISSRPRRTDVFITAGGTSLSSFVLKIKNADVNKEAALLGSNDGTKWFAVKDRFQLNRTSSPDRTEAFLDLTFPLSDYKLYKLSLNDSLSAPLNVVGVGRMKTESFYKQHLLEVPLKMNRIETKDKDSDLQLVLPFKFQVERLNFYVSSPRYYHRDLQLSQPFSGRFTTSLSNENGYPQPVGLSVYSDTLKLSIQNGDDQPLTVDSVKAFVRKYSLIAELKKGVNYTLTYGDPQATFPQYDLSFSKQLPDSIGRLFISDIERLPVIAQPEESSSWLTFLKMYGIWIVITLVIIQILYMVRKMVK